MKKVMHIALLALLTGFLSGAEFANNISHYTINSNESLGSLPTAYVPAADVYGLYQHPVSDVLLFHQ